MEEIMSNIDSVIGHCQINKCQFGLESTMAAALLSNRRFDKLLKNHVKYTKAFTNKSVKLNKPQFNIICQQCAAATYFRV